jgi:hypothetical protein
MLLGFQCWPAAMPTAEDEFRRGNSARDFTKTHNSVRLGLNLGLQHFGLCKKRKPNSLLRCTGIHPKTSIARFRLGGEVGNHGALRQNQAYDRSRLRHSIHLRARSR